MTINTSGGGLIMDLISMTSPAWNVIHQQSACMVQKLKCLLEDWPATVGLSQKTWRTFIEGIERVNGSL